MNIILIIIFFAKIRFFIEKRAIFAQENKKKMKFSIITINYNDSDGLERTIKSVISQSFKDFEFIVIDGGSTDASVDIIKKYEDKIDYWVSEPDGGIYNAMNKGVFHAHGEYCIFMNSGDCFVSDVVLSRFMDYKATEDIVVGKLISQKTGKVIFASPQQLSLYYLYSGTVPHQSSFIKTELLRKNPYDENLQIVSDWKFFVQAIILENCSVRYIENYVASFDMSGISTSNPERMWKEKELVLSSMFPPRVLADYEVMKASECMTQTLTPQLRLHYRIDKFLYKLGMMLLKLTKK